MNNKSGNFSIKSARTKELINFNLKYTALIFILNILVFAFLDRAKINYTLVSVYLNSFLLLTYLYKFAKTLPSKLNTYKREVLYINYPVSILFFLVFLSLSLLASVICLCVINPNAANLTFIFTFFMSTVSMFLPVIFTLVFINFIVPAFIIPNIKDNKKNSIIKFLIILLLVLLGISFLYNGYQKISSIANFNTQTKFRLSRLTVSYATHYLQLNNEISNRAKQLMSRDTVKVPFLYTTESFTYDNWEDADRFCRALDAKVPNYLEIYHIIFNRFDTFGDKYYWTNDKDGLQKEIPLVLHFKNMSYEIVRKPANVKPELFCVAPAAENYGLGERKEFTRNIQMESREAIQKMSEKPFNTDLLKDLVKFDNKSKQVYPPQDAEISVNREKKHVSFSVKEVPPEVFNQLIAKGYSYNPNAIIRKDYEINDSTLSNIVKNSTNQIRLCYFPFEDYGMLNMSAEREIWQQNFCSPAFDITSITPVTKTKSEKDAYCRANGGRLPNIPELAGILKTLGRTQPNVKYWTNIQIHNNSGNISSVYAYYKDSRFLRIEAAPDVLNEHANVFCVKKPKVPSIVIANYKSRFHGIEGGTIARQKCPSCKYYEVPDVTLQH